MNDSKYVGFTGSRNGFTNKALLKNVLNSLIDVPIAVGCARGVDAQIRRLRDDAVVYSVASPGAGSGSRSWTIALARRSMTMVDDCYLLIGFASVSCPLDVCPSHSFVGGGSGTWASLAYASGRGIPIVVFLDDGILLPEWTGGHWEKAGSRGTAFDSGWIWVPDTNTFQLSMLG